MYVYDICCHKWGFLMTPFQLSTCGGFTDRRVMWCSQVVSPNMFNMQLWETSGHAANYKENMFTFEVCHSFLNVHCVSVITYCLIILITICF